MIVIQTAGILVRDVSRFFVYAICFVKYWFISSYKKHHSYGFAKDMGLKDNELLLYLQNFVITELTI